MAFPSIITAPAEATWQSIRVRVDVDARIGTVALYRRHQDGEWRLVPGSRTELAEPGPHSLDLWDHEAPAGDTPRYRAVGYPRSTRSNDNLGPVIFSNAVTARV